MRLNAWSILGRGGITLALVQVVAVAAAAVVVVGHGYLNVTLL